MNTTMKHPPVVGLEKGVEPKLTEQLIAPGFAQKKVLTLVANLERYSKHPLTRAILAAALRNGLHDESYRRKGQ
jgi:cation transport ATPase